MTTRRIATGETDINTERKRAAELAAPPDQGSGGRRPPPYDEELRTMLREMTEKHERFMERAQRRSRRLDIMAFVCCAFAFGVLALILYRTFVLGL
jgi:hypothetical protein